jgi:hypothetical protein
VQVSTRRCHRQTGVNTRDNALFRRMAWTRAGPCQRAVAKAHANTTLDSREQLEMVAKPQRAPEEHAQQHAVLPPQVGADRR